MPSKSKLLTFSKLRLSNQEKKSGIHPWFLSYLELGSPLVFLLAWKYFRALLSIANFFHVETFSGYYITVDAEHAHTILLYGFINLM